MPDLNITSSGVAVANSSAVKAYGTSEAAISAGQVVYADPASTPPGLLKPAQGNSASGTVPAMNVVGIALDTAAGSGQPIAYVSSGDVILPTTGSGSVLVQGSVYVMSAANPGGITSANDPAAGTSYLTSLGLAVSPSTLRVNINPVGAVR